MSSINIKNAVSTDANIFISTSRILLGGFTTASSQPSTTTEKMNVDDISSSLQHFGVVDYVVFVLMLIACTLIGLYFGFIEKKNKNVKNDTKNMESQVGADELNYLVGGREMKIFPVSLSLIASFISGIFLLGVSTEIYVYGTPYAFILVPLAISGVISYYIVLPVFCHFQLTSAYEYLELRFNRKVRLLGSLMFSMGTLVWLPIVIYVPALAFNQVTGINIHIVTPIVCIVCIFYTTVGGLKAVVWTDVIQTIVMIGVIILIAVKGTMDMGGFNMVLQRNMESERLEWPKMTLDYTERISMFSMLVGSSFYYAQVIGGNQVIVQRYFALPSMKEVKWAIVWFTLGVCGLTAICIYNGLLLFATYYNCDPLTTKLAKARDQLVPLLVMDSLSVFPGVPGMFVAGVFSAALSSLSTGLNSLAAVCLEDYVKPLVKSPLTERQTSLIMRLSVILIGVICVALVFVVERLGSHVVQLSMTFGSITVGPLLGLFFMGFMYPRINSKSALTGCIVSFFVMSAICGRAQVAMNTGELAYPEKPVSIDGCTYAYEQPDISSKNATFYTPSDRNIAQHFYHMSIFFYGFFGGIVTTIVAFLSSFIFGNNDVSLMDINLFAPCIRRWIDSATDYASVATAEQTMSKEEVLQEKQRHEP